MNIQQIKISPIFEDEAFEVARFIQKLGHVCDSQLSSLFEKCKSNNWVEGMGDQDLYDWLFDYCYNGEDRACLFSEYLPDTKYVLSLEV